MSRKFLGIVLAAVVVVEALFVVNARSQENEALPVGYQRFVLFHSRYLASVDGKALEIESVFKIDTTTGQTWTYHSSTKDGQMLTGWLAID